MRCPGLPAAVRCRPGGADPFHLLGQARRKAVGRAATALGTSAAGLRADAGLALVGPSRLTAALALEWGAPTARASALRLGLEEVARWKRWLEQPPRLSAPASPRPEVLETIGQIGAQATEPAPEGGPGARRLKKPVAPDRRRSMEDADMRHGRQRSAPTGTGCQEPLALASKGPREGVGCPAHPPAHAAIERLAEALAPGAGLVQLDIALGARASPRMAPGGAPGGPSLARPWPPGGPLVPKDACPLACQHGPVTGPNAQPGPLSPGQDAQLPARACEACPGRAQWTKARRGQGRRLTLRADAQGQQKLRAQLQTTRGRASWRQRTAGEHALAPHVAHQGRRARSKGRRTQQLDGRRHAAGSDLQVAARYEEERQLAS